jgi:hypothetical protein
MDRIFSAASEDEGRPLVVRSDCANARESGFHDESMT